MRQRKTLFQRCLALVLILALGITLLPMGEASAKTKKATVKMKEKKVMAYLTELDNESGNTGEVVAPFNRERMAEYLGVTRPALSRAIGQLRDRGLLSWRKNTFKLKK